MRRTERTGRTSRALIEAGRREERGAGVENGAIDGGGCVRELVRYAWDDLQEVRVAVVAAERSQSVGISGLSCLSSGSSCQTAPTGTDRVELGTTRAPV